MIGYKTRTLGSQYRWQSRRKVLNANFASVGFIAFCSVVATIACLLYLWQWTTFFQINFYIQSLEKQTIALKQEIELLEIEKQYLLRPQRIAQLATKNLQMKFPSSQQFQQLSASQDHESTRSE